MNYTFEDEISRCQDKTSIGRETGRFDSVVQDDDYKIRIKRFEEIMMSNPEADYTFTIRNI